MNKEEAISLMGKTAEYRGFKGKLIKVGTANEGRIIVGHLDNGITVNMELLKFLGE